MAKSQNGAGDFRSKDPLHQAVPCTLWLWRFSKRSERQWMLMSQPRENGAIAFANRAFFYLRGLAAFRTFLLRSFLPCRKRFQSNLDEIVIAAMFTACRSS